MLNAVLLIVLSSCSVGAQDVPRLLFHYGFDGHVKCSFASEAAFRVNKRETPIEFLDDALIVKGNYDRDIKHVRTPSFTYDKFTVAMRFMPDPTSEANLNIVSGGSALRWFGMFRDGNSGRLNIALNNERFIETIPVRIESGKWHVIVCSVDLKQKTIRVHVNGTDFQEIRLADDFVLSPNEPNWAKRRESEKAWYFQCFMNGRTFKGLVDEFMVFNSIVAPDSVVEWYEVKRLERLILAKERLRFQAMMEYDERVVSNLRDTRKNRMERQLLELGITPSDQGLVDYLDLFASKIAIEKMVDQAIQQLGDRSFSNRDGASARLQAIGKRALPQLEEARGNGLGPEASWRTNRIIADSKQPSNRLTRKEEAEPVLSYLLGQPDSVVVPSLVSNLASTHCTFDRIHICETIVACATPANETYLRNCLNHSDKWIRVAAVCSLQTLVPKDVLRELLAPSLKDEDELVRLCACAAIGQHELKELCDSLTSLSQSECQQIKRLTQLLVQTNLQLSHSEGHELESLSSGNSN